MQEIMLMRTFAIVGDTTNPQKYAFKIKEAMTHAGYTVFPVGKELASLNDIDQPLDVVDLCINPIKGLKLLQECRLLYKMIVIQPGADNPELLSWLDQQNIPYIHGCLLKGLDTYVSKENN